MKLFRRAAREAEAPLPRLCEVCGQPMRVRSIAFTPKGSETTYRCRQCEAVALEMAPPLEPD
jgi:predicted SprT family Zn-dependent metalloprotease